MLYYSDTIAEMVSRTTQKSLPTDKYLKKLKMGEVYYFIQIYSSDYNTDFNIRKVMIANFPPLHTTTTFIKLTVLDELAEDKNFTLQITISTEGIPTNDKIQTKNTTWLGSNMVFCKDKMSTLKMMRKYVAQYLTPKLLLDNTARTKGTKELLNNYKKALTQLKTL